MSALWIARVDVKDADLYANYVEVASVVIPAHGGEFIARGGRTEVLEGTARSRNVVARFPSVEAAVAAYNDERYQDALKNYALPAADREIIVVEEV